MNSQIGIMSFTSSSSSETGGAQWGLVGISKQRSSGIGCHTLYYILPSCILDVNTIASLKPVCWEKLWQRQVDVSNAARAEDVPPRLSVYT
jgi:hypothetical protein